MSTSRRPATSTRLHRFRAAALLAALVSILSAAPAHAASLAQVKVGDNIQQLLLSIAQPVFIGVVAIVSVIFLISRKFGELAVFLVIAVFVGIFVLVPTQGEALITGISRAIAG